MTAEVEQSRTGNKNLECSAFQIPLQADTSNDARNNPCREVTMIVKSQTRLDS